MRYDDTNRGHIQNRDRARQIIDFSGMRLGSITPTDIDGLIEKDNRIFIFFEFKYNDAVMSMGQRIALERLVDDTARAGKEAVLFLCRHFVHDCNEDVDASKGLVTDIYWKGKWYKGTGLSVREQTDKYLTWAEAIV